MQIIKELPTGVRILVTQQQYENDILGPDRHKCVYFMRTQTATIYHMNGVGYRTPPLHSPKYGGRGRAMRHGNLSYCGG